jgi:hypothetical protein
MHNLSALHLITERLKNYRRFSTTLGFVQVGRTEVQ